MDDVLVEIDMEGREFHDLGEIAHVALLRPDLVDEVEAAVLALLGGARLRELEDVRFGHHVSVEGAGAEADVHHAGLHRLANLECRDRLRPADEVDLQDALAVLVDVGDPVERALHVELVLGESADQAQRYFLRAGDPGNCGERRGEHESGCEAGHAVSSSEGSAGMLGMIRRMAAATPTPAARSRRPPAHWSCRPAAAWCGSRPSSSSDG